ncbi:retrovirus-related pol polyprotein from transposon TNT 1-94 [Tanacetum coccineum]
MPNLLRYAKSRPNEKLIYNSIINGPYVRRMIPEPGDPNREVPVPETFHEQTDDELTKAEIKHIEVDDQAIQTILLGLPEDIYAAVDSCETAQEIWLRVQQMMKGSDIGIQEKKAKLFNEWERFTSTDGESIESYYHRFSKLMNDFKRNKHFSEKIASNLKFLNNLQPEWSRHVTIVHQTNDLHTADYTQLNDFLKYIQKEVDDLRAERLAKTHDPLALMANSNNPFYYPVFHPDQPSSSTYMQQPQPNDNYKPQPSFNHNYMQQPLPNPQDITDPTTAMNMALVLMAKAFKLNYSTPTNNNQRISSNLRNRQIAQPVKNSDVQNVGNQNGLIVVPGIANQNPNGNGNVVAARAEGNVIGNNGNLIRCYNCRGLGHLARNCTVRPRRRDVAYLHTQLLIAQKEEAGIQLQAEEFDLMAAAADLDEIKENYILMANLQQASTSGTQTDKAPVYDSDGLAEVHHYDNCYNNDIFNMFTQEEKYTELLEPIPEPHQVQQNDSNVISEVSNMEQSGGTIDQHPATVEETRAYFESLYNNLAIEVAKDEIFPIINQVDARLQNFEIQFLKEAAEFVRDFKSLAKEADESLAKPEGLELEIERLLRAVVSQDIMSIVQNPSVVDSSNLQTELDRTKERFENCIIKKENKYAKLWNDWYKKCEECKYDKIMYDKAYNDMQQKIKRLQAQLGDQKGKSKDTLSLSKPVTSNSVPTPQESKVVKNDKVIAPGMFRIIPFNPSREEKSVSNKVRASVRTNPITISQPHVIPKKDVNSDSNGLSSTGVDNTAKTRRPQPRSNTKNDRVPSASKSSCNKNKEVEVEEHPRNLLLSKNKKHMSSEFVVMASTFTHLNFDAINDLAKNDLVTGLPKFKYHKEHLCPSCEQGKSKRASHPLKPVPNSKQRLHLLHMDLCGPISKDETPEVIKTFLKRITVLLQSPGIIIRIDNGTEFKNEILNRKLDISFLHVFGALCYPKNDLEDVGKLGAKGDIGYFIGYSCELKNKAFKTQLYGMTRDKKPISLGLILLVLVNNKQLQQPSEGEMDFTVLMLCMMINIGGQPSTAPRTTPAAQAPPVRQTPTASTKIADTAPTPTK